MKTNIIKKIFLGVLSLTFGITLFSLCGQDVYASAVKDIFSENEWTAVSSNPDAEDIANITVVDNLESISFSSITDNPEYLYVKSNNQAYKLLYYTTVKTIGEKSQNQTYPIYAPITATLDGKWQISDKGITYSYYDILKYMPSWEEDGITYYDGGNNVVYFESNGTTEVSNPNNAYYKYELVEGSENYFKYQDIYDANLVFKYKDGTTISFNDITPSEYNEIIDTIVNLNAKQYEYELMIEVPNETTEYKLVTDENGKYVKVHDSNWKEEYETAYYYEGNIYIWDEVKGKYLIYSLEDLKNFGYVTEAEVNNLLNTGNINDNYSVLLEENDSLVVKIKDNYDLIKKTYEIASCDTTRLATVYYEDKAYIWDNTKQEYNGLTCRIYAFDEASNTPTHFDTTYEYWFSYQSEMAYNLYKVLYEKVLYNYHHEIDEYTVTQDTEYTITQESSDTTYNFTESCIYLSNLNGTVKDAIQKVGKTLYNIDKVYNDKLASEQVNQINTVVPTYDYVKGNTIYETNSTTARHINGNSWYYSLTGNPDVLTSAEDESYNATNLNVAVKRVYSLQVSIQKNGKPSVTNSNSNLTSVTFDDTDYFKNKNSAKLYTSSKISPNDYNPTLLSGVGYSSKTFLLKGNGKWGDLTDYFIKIGDTWYHGTNNKTYPFERYSGNVPSGYYYCFLDGKVEDFTYDFSYKYKDYEKKDIYEYNGSYFINKIPSSRFIGSCNVDHYDGCNGTQDCNKYAYTFKGTRLTSSVTKGGYYEGGTEDYSNDTVAYFYEQKTHGSGNDTITVGGNSAHSDGKSSDGISKWGEAYFNPEIQNGNGSASIISSPSYGSHNSGEYKFISNSYSGSFSFSFYHPETEYYNTQYYTVTLSQAYNGDLYFAKTQLPNDITSVKHGISIKDGKYFINENKLSDYYQNNYNDTDDNKKVTIDFNVNNETVSFNGINYFFYNLGNIDMQNYMVSGYKVKANNGMNIVYLTESKLAEFYSKKENELYLYDGTIDDFVDNITTYLNTTFKTSDFKVEYETKAMDINSELVSYYTPYITLNGKKTEGCNFPRLYTKKDYSTYRMTDSAKPSVETHTGFKNVKDSTEYKINIDTRFGTISENNKISNECVNSAINNKPEYSLNNQISGLNKDNYSNYEIVKTDSQTILHERYIFDNIITDSNPNSKKYLIIVKDAEVDVNDFSNFYSEDKFSGYYKYFWNNVDDSTSLVTQGYINGELKDLTADDTLNENFFETNSNYYQKGNFDERYKVVSASLMGLQYKERKNIRVTLSYDKKTTDPSTLPNFNLSSWNNEYSYKDNTNIQELVKSKILSNDYYGDMASDGNYILNHGFELTNTILKQGTAFYSATPVITIITYQSPEETITYGSNNDSIAGFTYASKYGTLTNVSFDNNLANISGDYTFNSNEILGSSRNQFNQINWFDNLGTTNTLKNKILKEYKDSYFVIKNLTNEDLVLFSNDDSNKVLGYTLKSGTPDERKIILSANGTLEIKDIYLNDKNATLNKYTPYVELSFGNLNSRTFKKGSILKSETVYSSYNKLSDNDKQKGYAKYYENFDTILYSNITGYLLDDKVKSLKDIISKYESDKINVNHILYSLAGENSNYILDKTSSYIDENCSRTANEQIIENDEVKSKYYYRIRSYKEGVKYIATTTLDLSSSLTGYVSENEMNEFINENREFSVSDFTSNPTLLNKIYELLRTNGYNYYFNKENQIFRIFYALNYRKYTVSHDINKNKYGVKLDSGYTGLLTEDELTEVLSSSDKNTLNKYKISYLSYDDSLKLALGTDTAGKIQLTENSGIPDKIYYHILEGNNTSKKEYTNATKSYLLSNNFISNCSESIKNLILKGIKIDKNNSDYNGNYYKLIKNDNGQTFTYYDEYDVVDTKEYLTFTKDYVFVEKTGSRNIYYLVYDENYRNLIKQYQDDGRPYDAKELLGDISTGYTTFNKSNENAQKYINLYIDEFGDIYANKNTNLYWDTQNKVWTSNGGSSTQFVKVDFSSVENFNNSLKGISNLTSGFEIEKTIDTYNLCKYINKVGIYVDDYDNIPTLDINNYTDSSTNLTKEIFKIRTASDFVPTYYLKNSLNLNSNDLGISLTEENSNMIEINNYIYKNNKIYALTTMCRDGVSYNYNEQIINFKRQIDYFIDSTFANGNDVDENALNKIDSKTLYAMFYGINVMQQYKGFDTDNWWKGMGYWFSGLIGQNGTIYYTEPLGTLNGRVIGSAGSYNTEEGNIYRDDVQSMTNWGDEVTTVDNTKTSTLEFQTRYFLQQFIKFDDELNNGNFTSSYFDYLFKYCTKTVNGKYDATKLLMLYNFINAMPTNSYSTNNNYIILNVGNEQWIYKEINCSMTEDDFSITRDFKASQLVEIGKQLGYEAESIYSQIKYDVMKNKDELVKDSYMALNDYGNRSNSYFVGKYNTISSSICDYGARASQLSAMYNDIQRSVSLGNNNKYKPTQDYADFFFWNITEDNAITEEMLSDALIAYEEHQLQDGTGRILTVFYGIYSADKPAIVPRKAYISSSITSDGRTFNEEWYSIEIDYDSYFSNDLVQMENGEIKKNELKYSFIPDNTYWNTRFVKINKLKQNLYHLMRGLILQGSECESFNSNGVNGAKVKDSKMYEVIGFEGLNTTVNQTPWDGWYELAGTSTVFFDPFNQSVYFTEIANDGTYFMYNTLPVLEAKYEIVYTNLGDNLDTCHFSAVNENIRNKLGNTSHDTYNYLYCPKTTIQTNDGGKTYYFKYEWGNQKVEINSWFDGYRDLYTYCKENSGNGYGGIFFYSAYHRNEMSIEHDNDLYIATPYSYFSDIMQKITLKDILDFYKNKVDTSVLKDVYDTNTQTAYDFKNQIKNTFTHNEKDYYNDNFKGKDNPSYKEVNDSSNASGIRFLFGGTTARIFTRFNDKMNEVSYLCNPFFNQNIYSKINGDVLINFYDYFMNTEATAIGVTDRNCIYFNGEVYLPINTVELSKYFRFENGKAYLLRSDNHVFGYVEDEYGNVEIKNITSNSGMDLSSAVYIVLNNPLDKYELKFMNYFPQKATNKVYKNGEYSLFYEYQYYNTDKTTYDISSLDYILKTVDTSGKYSERTMVLSRSYTNSKSDEELMNLYKEAMENGETFGSLEDFIEYRKNAIYGELRAQYPANQYFIVDDEINHCLNVYSYSGKDASNLAVYSYFVHKYQLIQDIEDSKKENLLYYNITKGSNKTDSQMLNLRFNEQCVIRLYYDISWVGKDDQNNEVTIFTEADKEFIEKKAHNDFSDSIVVHYPKLQKSRVYIILNDFENFNIVSSQYYNFDLRNNKDLTNYSMVLERGFNLNLELVGSSKYTLEVYNIFGVNLLKKTFNTDISYVRNPFGTTLAEKDNAPTKLKTEYISKNLKQLIYSDGSVKYGAENNGIVYTLPKDYRLTIEKNTTTAKNLIVYFKSDDTKAISGNMIIKNFYENGTDLKVEVRNGSVTIPISELKKNNWNFESKISKYLSASSFELTNDIVRRFFSEQILSKYVIEFNLGSNIKNIIDNVQIYAYIGYSSDYCYLDLNQNGKCGSLIGDSDLIPPASLNDFVMPTKEDYAKINPKPVEPTEPNRSDYSNDFLGNLGYAFVYAYYQMQYATYTSNLQKWNDDYVEYCNTKYAEYVALKAQYDKDVADYEKALKEGTKKYYDFLGNRVVTETKYVPNSYLGLYNVSKFENGEDATNISNVQLTYENKDKIQVAVDIFKIIKTQSGTFLFYETDNGTTMIVK